VKEFYQFQIVTGMISNAPKLSDTPITSSDQNTKGYKRKLTIDKGLNYAGGDEAKSFEDLIRKRKISHNDSPGNSDTPSIAGGLAKAVKLDTGMAGVGRAARFSTSMPT
jgi:hypothetical protein